MECDWGSEWSGLGEREGVLNVLFLYLFVVVCLLMFVYRQLCRKLFCMTGLVSMGDRCMCHLAEDMRRNRGQRVDQFPG